MSQFDPEVFMSKPDGDVFFNLRKGELVTLGRYLQLRLEEPMLKTIIQAEIVSYLVKIKVFWTIRDGYNESKMKVEDEKR